VSQLPWKELREAAGDDGVNRVPDGWYDCTVKSTKVGQTAAPNNYKKINARFVVINGPYAGSSLFKDFVITTDKPGGLKFFFRHMGVLGVNKEHFTDDLTVEALADRLLDRSAQVQVGTRIWNEQERMEVKDLKAPTTGSVYDSPVSSYAPAPGGVAGLSVPEPPAMEYSSNELPPEPPF
jgi:hypothetical protein